MKSDLRHKMKIKRRYLGEIVRLEADRAILEAILAALSDYDSFFVYNSFSTEARTDWIIEELLSMGKRVYLPRVDGNDIVAVPYGKTVRGSFGIDEPEGEAFGGVADVTVVPLLAVNERGFRIGYGGGYYDRYLKDKPTLKVGIGYGFQLEEFAEEAHDVPLDMFICERGIYYFGKERKG